uniref:Transmembrane protein n=1 Tax=Pinctada fucata TaxID=50426 RepID=A0A194ALS9_PINFU
MERGDDEKKRSKPSKEELSVFPVAVPLGLLSTFLVGFGTYWFMSSRIPRLDNALDRLLYTFRWLTLSAFTILVFVLRVGSIRRNTSAIDPTTGHEHYVEVPNRILQTHSNNL